MTRREKIETERRSRRLKRLGFVVFVAMIVGACGKATLTRAPEDVREIETDVTAQTITEPSAEVTRAGIVKPVKIALYEDGTHYLENDAGEFDVLLVSTALDLTAYEDQMVELSGTLQAIPGDDTVQLMMVSGLASVSAKINGDAIDAVKRLADPSYGFDDADTYTIVDSSATAGTAVIQVQHGAATYHVKLVRKPDPITGEWEIYDTVEGAYVKDAAAVPSTEGDPVDGATPTPATDTPAGPGTVGEGDITTDVPVREGFTEYADQFAGFTVQYPKGWFFWAVGEAQTAEGKSVSSRVLFSDAKVEYENVLVGIDIAPNGFEQTTKGYYIDHAKEERITVRGKDALRRTYTTGHVRVFIPRDGTTTFIISAIPQAGGLRTDVLEGILATLELQLP